MWFGLSSPQGISTPPWDDSRQGLWVSRLPSHPQEGKDLLWEQGSRIHSGGVKAVMADSVQAVGCWQGTAVASSSPGGDLGVGWASWMDHTEGNCEGVSWGCLLTQGSVTRQKSKPMKRESGKCDVGYGCVLPSRGRNRSWGVHWPFLGHTDFFFCPLSVSEPSTSAGAALAPICQDFP